MTFQKSVSIIRTPRVRQLEGMFDIPPAERSVVRWDAALPLEEREWQIGLIVGPSGCGKSTLARELFGAALIDGYDWPEQNAIVDAFPAALGIKEVVCLLSSVGFSSPPSWLRPFRALSNGEQFRVTIARALAEKPKLAVIDEFTSVVDRTVARIGSAAIAKSIRRSQRRLVAVSCHYDIIDWLSPDWIYDPAANEFQWRCLREPGEETNPLPGDRQRPCRVAPRPPIELEVARVHRQAWALFQHHHYLSGGLHRAAKCFVAFVAERVKQVAMVEEVEGDMLFDPFDSSTASTRLRPAAFTAVLHAPGASGGYWREHRTVCLPDFQGVGIGNALSEFVASLFVATGKRYCSRTSHPAMIRHRAASRLWSMKRGISWGARHTGNFPFLNRTAAIARLIAGFRFVGASNYPAAREFGIIPHDDRSA